MPSESIKISKTTVEALKPVAGRQVIHWDRDLKGFGVRVSPGGTRTFFIQGRMRGDNAVVKRTIGQFGRMTAEQARKSAKTLLSRLELGENIRTAKPTGNSLGDLLTAYGDYLESKGSPSVRLVRAQLKKDVEKAFPALWAKPATAVTLADCMTAIRKLKDEKKPRQADKLRAYLKAAYGLAVGAKENPDAPKELIDMEIKLNPVRDIKKIEGSSEADKRALKLPELRAYWRRIQELPEPRRSVAMLHVLTAGQRMKQLSRVKTSDIDRHDMRMKMRDPKGKRSKPRVYFVPLLPEALSCIDRITGTGDYVFSSDGGLSPMHESYLSSIASDVCAAMAEAGELMGPPFTGKAIRSSLETHLRRRPHSVSSDILGLLLSHGLGSIQAKNYNDETVQEVWDELRHAVEQIPLLLNGESAEAEGQEVAA